MTKGFFISVSELKKPRKAAAIGMKWSGLPVEAPRGWKIIYSETLEHLMCLQREEFMLRRDMNGSLPRLVNAEDRLLATGKMTRFVEIGP